MSENVLKLVYYIMYSVEIFLVGEALFHNKVKEKIKYIVMTVLYLLVMIPTILLIDNPFFLVPLALNILIYIVLFQGKLLLRLTHFLGVYIFTGMAESVVGGICSFLFDQPVNSIRISVVTPEGRVVVVVITTVLILVIITRRPIQNFIGYFQVLKWFQYVAIIMIALSGTLVMAISEVVLEYIDNKEVGNVLHTATLLLLVTTFVGIVWFISSVYGKEYYLKQNQLKEEIIISQHKYYNSIYENDREMRKFRHDIRSQLGCLQLLLAEGKTDKAIKHLSLVENNFKQIDTHKYHTGNEILDVIINQKCSEAKKRDIDIRVEGRLTASEFIDAYDMCTIFANALNNGMEACDRIQDTGKIILVSILEHGNTILFQFANPATTEMYETVKKGKTIKEDSQNHGLGMENIRMAVEKNGGELQYQYNDGKITLEIFFEV